MIKIVGVRFRKAGKIYYFDPAGMEIETGTHVIVETARGIEFGTVMIPPREMEEDGVVQPLKPVIRIATEADEITEQKNKEKEKEAFQICLEKIAKHKLEMKLVEAEYTFDNNKLLFYFTADGRIDFRELVKDLAFGLKSLPTERSPSRAIFGTFTAAHPPSHWRRGLHSPGPWRAGKTAGPPPGPFCPGSAAGLHSAPASQWPQPGPRRWAR